MVHPKKYVIVYWESMGDDDAEKVVFNVTVLFIANVISYLETILIKNMENNSVTQQWYYATERQ